MKKGTCKFCGAVCFRPNHVNQFTHCRTRQPFDVQGIMPSKVEARDEVKTPSSPNSQPKGITVTNNSKYPIKAEIIVKKPYVSQKAKTDAISNANSSNKPIEAGVETKSKDVSVPNSEDEVSTSDNEEQKLEIQKPEIVEAVNPNDYKYVCSYCKELFNELKDGRCPECGIELNA